MRDCIKKGCNIKKVGNQTQNIQRLILILCVGLNKFLFTTCMTSTQIGEIRASGPQELEL